mmetsp:Transcript_12442/g.20144  ORF Transcript_12442/g.20144 Transcript_12442/m.20144 type:complete len:425 (+) Transcript_12442:124-1398(+)
MGEQDWGSFSLPNSRELTEAEDEALKISVRAQLEILTNEKPDETLVEYLIVLLSNHTTFGEIATSLEDVAEGDYPRALCKWLVQEVKNVLKIGPTPEEELAIMKEQFRQLEEEKAELAKKVTEQEQKGNVSLKDLRAMRQERLDKEEDDRKKRRLEDRDDAALDVAEMYGKYLTSGFQGDFYQYRISLDPVKRKQAEEEAAQMMSKEEPAETNNVDFEERKKSLTWSRLPESEEKAKQVTDMIIGTNTTWSRGGGRGGRGRGRGSPAARGRGGGFQHMSYTNPKLQAQNQSESEGSGTNATTTGGFGAGATRGGFGNNSGRGGFGNQTWGKGAEGTNQTWERKTSPVANQTWQRPGLASATESPSNSAAPAWGQGRGARGGYRGRGSTYRGRGRGARGGTAHQQWVRPDLAKSESISNSLPSTP